MESDNTVVPGSPSKKEIADYLKNIKFRKKLFGGADEYDVWRKIKKLDEMYQKEIEKQKLQYEALIAEREDWCRQAMKQRGEGQAGDSDDGG